MQQTSRDLSVVVWLAQGARARLGICANSAGAAPAFELIEHSVSLPKQLGLSIRHLQTFPLHHILNVLTVRKLALTVFLSPHVNTTC